MAIETDRLILRLYNEQDFALLREIDSEPAVLRYRSRKTITPKMTRRFLAFARQSRWEDPRTFFAYAIENRTGKIGMGQCGMAAISEKDSREKSVYLWYSLLPRYWGKGYMTEAVQALIQLGFSKFGLAIISAECEPENIASYRVMEKAGLIYTGPVVREDKQGNQIDRVHYELSYADFQKGVWPPVKITDPV